MYVQLYSRTRTGTRLVQLYGTKAVPVRYYRLLDLGMEFISQKEQCDA